MAEKWEYLFLKATNWRLILSLWQVGDVFTCKLCSIQRTLQFSVLLMWWNANIWEPEQSDVPWTYILSPLLPCWLEPCLGVDGLDVNSMTPGWQRVMWRPFHVVLFYLHAASFRQTGFGTSLPGQKKLGEYVGVISTVKSNSSWPLNPRVRGFIENNRHFESIYSSGICFRDHREGFSDSLFNVTASIMCLWL